MTNRKNYHMLDAKNQHIATIHYTHVAKNIARNPEMPKVKDPETGEIL